MAGWWGWWQRGSGGGGGGGNGGDGGSGSGSGGGGGGGGVARSTPTYNVQPLEEGVRLLGRDAEQRRALDHLLPREFAIVVEVHRVEQLRDLIATCVGNRVVHVVVRVHGGTRLVVALGGDDGGRSVRGGRQAFLGARLDRWLESSSDEESEPDSSAAAFAAGFCAVVLDVVLRCVGWSAIGNG